MSEEISPYRHVEFEAIFSTCKKSKDGGWHITFEVSRDFTGQVSVASLLDTSVLRVTVEPIA